MFFDPDNKIVRLCAEGMQLEGKGNFEAAQELFSQAWEASQSDLERFIAAHYVARHQKSASSKLKWDEESLHYALKIKDERIKTALPSIHLNIGKCYEDLSDIQRAQEHYQLAWSYGQQLPNDGYGNMIKAGIRQGLERTFN